tara:strand:- start:260 stop:394 length:135 start_codon:yes stop_codon:yes gene_type:complete
MALTMVLTSASIVTVADLSLHINIPLRNQCRYNSTSIAEMPWYA